MKINLSNLKSASPQQVFEQVARHLLTQKERCAIPGGACKYRFEGLMCAGGCLIDDSEYTINFDISKGRFGTSWEALILREMVPNAHCDLIIKLQDIHDSHSVGLWKGSLIKLAEYVGLDSSFLAEFN